MSPFTDRHERFDLNMPLSFKTQDEVVKGHCVNVSASGMLAVFKRPVELFTPGEITLLVVDYFVSIAAKVVRVRGSDHGLAFQIRSDSDRLTVHILIDFAETQDQPNQITPEQ